MLALRCFVFASGFVCLTPAVKPKKCELDVEASESIVNECKIHGRGLHVIDYRAFSDSPLTGNSLKNILIYFFNNRCFHKKEPN